MSAFEMALLALMAPCALFWVAALALLVAAVAGCGRGKR